MKGRRKNRNATPGSVILGDPRELEGVSIVSNRSLSVVLLVIGVLLFLFALGADSLGVGAAPGLGWKQISAAVVGVILAAVGIVKLRQG
jgi:hypothetical protein